MDFTLIASWGSSLARLQDDPTLEVAHGGTAGSQHFVKSFTYGTIDSTSVGLEMDWVLSKIVWFSLMECFAHVLTKNPGWLCVTHLKTVSRTEHRLLCNAG